MFVFIQTLIRNHLEAGGRHGHIYVSIFFPSHSVENSLMGGWSGCAPGRRRLLWVRWEMLVVQSKSDGDDSRDGERWWKELMGFGDGLYVEVWGVSQDRCRD